MMHQRHGTVSLQYAENWVCYRKQANLLNLFSVLEFLQIVASYVLGPQLKLWHSIQFTAFIAERLTMLSQVASIRRSCIVDAVESLLKHRIVSYDVPNIFLPKNESQNT